ncbi:hypothetical protein [Kordiimonas sp.]|uniref:hypothetical protein n=1 Tax=Kordiimonas sp. TaxID=1970157 RepID=UPI003A90EA8C
MEKLKVTLDWEGSLKPGEFPAGPEVAEEMGLESPGVYLCIQRYPNVTVLYAGKSMCLRKRIHEHLASTLGFQYWRRKDNPVPRSSFQTDLDNANRKAADALYLENEYAFIRPDKFGLGQFNDLKNNIGEAIREVERTEFYYCSIEKGISINTESGARPDVITTNALIAELEAALIGHTLLFAAQHNHVVCDNSRRETATGSVITDSQAFASWLNEKFSQKGPIR